MGGRGAKVGGDKGVSAFTVRTSTGHTITYTRGNGNNLMKDGKVVTGGKGGFDKAYNNAKNQGMVMKTQTSSELKKEQRLYQRYRADVEKAKGKEILGTGTTNKYGRTVGKTLSRNQGNFLQTFEDWKKKNGF